MVEARKTVTVLFADVAGSTALGEALDPEAVRRVMERFFAEARSAIEHHGGTVEKFAGDAVMAVFGVPVVHEDDALRAVRAASEMRERLAALNAELGRERGVTLALRTGVNTGEVVAGDPSSGESYATGDAVNVAARLEQAATPGDILLGEATYRLVRDDVQAEAVAPLDLKGKAALVAAYRLELVEGAPGVPGRFETPFIGRREELDQLRNTFERVVAERVPLLVTVLGPAGIGKSRLVAELSTTVHERARVLAGRCLSYGEGITFWPLQEILRSVPERPADLPDPEQARSTEEIFWAYRKLFERLAAERPLVLILEDIHWAESTLLELLEHVVEWTRDVPLLLLCIARPDLLEERPSWPGERFELEPLGEGDVAALLSALTDGLAGDERTRIAAAADGNPLFAEQMAALTLEDDGGEAEVPVTIQALLGARIDRLDADERALFECATVVGKEFWRGALLELSSPGTEVSAILQRLVRRRLITPERSSFPGEDAFHFAHVLVRDAGYAGIPKGRRADLHEHFADWLERSASPHGEIVGYHLEQAYGYLGELGPLDDHGRELGVRAAARLSSAGERAFARGDVPAAANMLRRAVGMLPDDDPTRLALLPALGEAMMGIGEFAWAETFLDEAIGTAEAVGEGGLATSARLLRLRVRSHSVDPEDWTGQVVAEADRSLPLLEAAGDDVELARALRMLAWAHGTACRYGEAAAAAQRAMEHASLGEDRRQLQHAASQYAIAALHGPTPVPEAIERCETIVGEAVEDRRTQGLVMSELSLLRAMRGEFGAARDLYTRARLMLADLGRSIVAASTSLESCRVEMLAGDPAAAERELRRDFAELSEMGERYFLSTVAAELSLTLSAQGREDEAEVFGRTAKELAAEDDVATQALWRLGQAKVLARRGEYEPAIELATEAVERMRATDAFVMKGDALVDLAEVLHGAGRADEARKALEEAMDLFERKGNVVAAAKTGRALGRSASASSLYPHGPQ
jgi:class 3 adenylate cyclase/tetratricopeptide (TPR) repeat protein